MATIKKHIDYKKKLVDYKKKVRKFLAANTEMVNFMNDHLMDLADEQEVEYDDLYNATEEAKNELCMR